MSLLKKIITFDKSKSRQSLSLYNYSNSGYDQ